MALASSAQEAVWMRQLSSEKVLSLQNKSLCTRIINTIAMTKNSQFHERTKHRAIKYHYIQEQVNCTILLDRKYYVNQTSG